ncbi:MAG: NAD(P)/FAD-dependent oxidoreductase [Nitrososphaerota archaeon]
MTSRQTVDVNPENKEHNWELHTSGQSESPWFKDIGRPLKFGRLAQNISVDVAIVGGGIAGVTTAYLLSKSGKSVALLEDGYIGSGETGRTTAHITHALDDRYYNIEKNHGTNSARIAADSHTSAINFIDRTVREERIDCQFSRLNGYLFLDPTDDKSSLDKELAALKNAGISSAKIESKSPLESKETSPCICFEDQGQFQPMLYLTAIAKKMSQNNDVKIFTETHAQEIQTVNSTNVIKTNSGYTVTAKDVVLATNAPIIDNVRRIYDKQVAYRTYVVVAEIQKNSIPSALYWDTGNQNSEDHVKPYHYVRIQQTGNETNDLLIVGGEDHKTGSPNDRTDFDTKFKNLETWMRKIFSVDGPVVYNWSGQVMEPLDGLAIIGPNPGKDKNIYIATGDSGNGITHGTIAGIILHDLILGKNNPWAELYNPNRNIR